MMSMKYHLTKYEQERLAQIRQSLETFTALGFETDTWEARFFLDLIDKMRGRGVAVEK